MTTTTDPVFASKTVSVRTQAITASSSSAGDSVMHTAATSRVEISNRLSPKWPVEYRVGSAAWVEVGEGKSTWLDIDLSTATLKIRRSSNAPASVDVVLTFEGVPAGLTAGTGGADVGIFTESETAAIQALVSGDRVLARTYVASGSRQALNVNNARVDLSPTRMQIHDAMPENGSLLDPLSGMANFSLLNVGRSLEPIPGAVSAPYWTDPGPLLYSYDGSTGDGPFPANIPGLIDFVTHIDGRKYIKFTCPPGYGEGAAGNGNRRTQLQSQQISARQTVRWELEFMVPPDDDGPYDVATGYNYPVLFWQVKLEDSQPVWTAAFVTTSTPGVYQLRIGFLYSDWPADPGTHRRQINSASAGSFNNISSTTVYTTLFSRGVLQTLSLEMRLDERDLTISGSGEGYCIIKHNGERVVNWSGPTLQKVNISGSAAGPHRWSLGPYQYQFFAGGVPTGLDELDLGRQVDPAPYKRSIMFSRATLLQLEGPRFDRLAPKAIGSSRTLTARDNGCVLECTAGGLTLTVPDDLVDAGFRCWVIPNGTTSVARSGTATLNGAATTITRTAASNAIFEIIQRANSLTSFVVSGV